MMFFHLSAPIFVLIMPALYGRHCSGLELPKIAETSALDFSLAYGVKFNEIGHVGNFDDTFYMLQDTKGGANDQVTRVLSGVRCYHQNPHNEFVGIREYYNTKDRVYGLETTVRGCSSGINGGSNYHHLGAGEYWTSVTYRHCGRVFSGIHFETNFGNSVSCGYYNFRDPGPHKYCGGSTLAPSKDREIIGIFGNENCNAFTSDKGIRGIGVISVQRSKMS